jgi:hypothetical protein
MLSMPWLNTPGARIRDAFVSVMGCHTAMSLSLGARLSPHGHLDHPSLRCGKPRTQRPHTSSALNSTQSPGRCYHHHQQPAHHLYRHRVQPLNPDPPALFALNA